MPPRVLAALLLLCARALAQDDLIDPVTGFSATLGSAECLGADAPAGVTGTRLHPTGEWMLRVSVERTRQAGLRDGHSDVGLQQAFAQGYTMAPRDMTMVMTMVEAMYGLSDDVTLMAMLPYVNARMSMELDDGTEFTMNSQGVGDLQLGALLLLAGAHAGDEQLLFNAGLSLPTGSITNEDSVPGCPDCPVDYPMQPGSGTVDLRPALTWLARDGATTWGAQLALVQRLGENTQDWTAGNRQDLALWAARRLGEETSGSLRLTARRWGRTHGQDDDLDPMMSPTMDPALQGGRRVDTSAGLRWRDLALELGAPLAEKLDGPQLSTDWFASLSWSLAF